MNTGFRLTTFLLAGLCLAPATGAAATRVETPADTLLYVFAADCAAPRSDVWRRQRVFLGASWWLVGAPEPTWEVDVDLERTAAMGVPLSSLREHVTGEAVTAGERGLARVLLEGILKRADGTELPGQALIRVQRVDAPTERLFVDGEAVVAAASVGFERGWLGLSFAAVVLARTCGTSPDHVKVLDWPPARVAWRISYRASGERRAVPPRGPIDWTRAEGLEKAVRESRGATSVAGHATGHTIGWHRAFGGALWGIRQGTTAPKVPAAAALRMPSTHVLVQRASGSAWVHALQAVLRFAAASPEAVVAGYHFARQVAARAGHGTRVVLLGRDELVDFEPDVEKATAAGFRPDDLRFLQDRGAVVAAEDLRVHIRISPERLPDALAVVGPDGRSHSLGSLGSVARAHRVTAPPSPELASQLFLCIPAEAVFQAAAAVESLPLPEGVRYKIVNWNLLSQADGAAILAWWEGLE